jgi:hypothetical protein
VNADLKYAFFTPHHRGSDLVFDFLRDVGPFVRAPWSVKATYGYERAQDTRVYAEDCRVGTIHSINERFATIAPAYQDFMRAVEAAATEWASQKQSAEDAQEMLSRQEDAALCERILAASAIEARRAATTKIDAVHESAGPQDDAHA